jgi:F0F1-type ATP synthase assembly protein I
MSSSAPNSGGSYIDPSENKSQPKKSPWAQVGRYTQMAFALPAAVVVGWLIGSAFDRWLHTSWISIVGLVLGMVGGLVDVIRTALRDAK